MIRFVSWGVAVLFLAAALFVTVLNLQSRAELASLSADLKKNEKPAMAAVSKTSVKDEAELQQLLKENQELPKIRAEYQKLKRENSDLQSQIARQKAQDEADVRRLEQQKLSLERAGAVRLGGRPGPVSTDTAARACIANLKQLESAKEQWALENRKAAEATPREDELVGPDKYIFAKPVCPAGGVYTLNSLNQRPHCSIPGHVLP